MPAYLPIARAAIRLLKQHRHQRHVLTKSARVGIVRGFNSEPGVTVKGRVARLYNAAHRHIIGVVVFTLEAKILQRDLPDQKQRANTTLVDGRETKD